MTQGPIKYVQNLFFAISSASLACNLPYFYIAIFLIGECQNYLLISGQHL